MFRDAPTGHSASSPWGEGHRQLVVVGTTPCTQPWGYTHPDARCQPPQASATSAFLFRQITSLLSLLSCLRFRGPTSATFGDCVAFFRGRARKRIRCPACLSSVPVGAGAVPQDWAAISISQASADLNKLLIRFIKLLFPKQKISIKTKNVSESGLHVSFAARSRGCSSCPSPL